VSEQVPDRDDPSPDPVLGVPLFGPSSLEAQVQRFLDTDHTVPEHHGVVLLVDEHGADVALALRTTSGWFVDLHAGYQWGGDVLAGVRVAKSW
jgi:hypothetical protein